MYKFQKFDTLEKYPEKFNIDVREELVSFQKMKYSANLMNLVVLGKEGLDELEVLIKSKFRPIRNNMITRHNFTDEIPSYNQLNTQILGLYKSINEEENSFFLVFPLAPVVKLYREKPLRYISNLINFRGKGSLFSHLKSRDYIYYFKAGVF